MTTPRHDVVPETGSTNEDLLVIAADPAYAAAWPHGSSLRALRQSAGRGRSGRSWDAPGEGALTASVLLRPRVPLARLAGVTSLAGLAVLDALAALDVFDPPDVPSGPATAGAPRCGLKWPNDVVVDSANTADTARPAATATATAAGGPAPAAVAGWGSLRKIGGILAQAAPAQVPATAPHAGAEQEPGTTPAPETTPAVVVGIGLNLAQSSRELPVPWAASLALVGARVPDADALWAAILDQLVGRLVPAWEHAGGELAAVPGLLDRLAAVTTTLGQTVRVERAGGGTPLQGVAEALDGEGRLVVRSGDGARHVIDAGDVAHVRRDE